MLAAMPGILDYVLSGFMCLRVALDPSWMCTACVTEMPATLGFKIVSLAWNTNSCF